MFNKATLLSFATLAIHAAAQQVGTNTAETHPALTFQKCTGANSCTTQTSAIVLDANWRWVHQVGGYTNCYTGNTWNTTACPDDATCAKNCALEGADYSGTYGITTSGNALRLNFVTKGSNTNIGSRTYLMAPGSTSNYQLFTLLNQEFTFDVDVSHLPCGLNGALYMSEMDADGGMSKYSGNKAGAKYGTGYCDSQCPHDIKFINGEANADGWEPSSNDSNAGTGKYGTCCNELDIWEANSISTAYTPHPCSVDGQYRCSGDECGDGDNRYGGVCDKDGCDFNSYRLGETDFYGPGMTVDTNSKFTVVTQFLTSDGTSSGTLNEMRRLYVQNGKVIANSKVNIPGIDASFDSVTTDFCTQQKAAFGDTNSWADHGGWGPMNTAFKKGMVLVLSLWDDHAVNMLWLDSDYPLDKDASTPGVARGTCPTTSGVPSDVEGNAGSSYVIYSNIKYGPIGSTYTGTTTGTGSSSGGSSGGSTPTSSAQGAGQTLWGQCGGTGYSGPTTCAQGTCKYSNPWYSQCTN